MRACVGVGVRRCMGAGVRGGGGVGLRAWRARARARGCIHGGMCVYCRCAWVHACMHMCLVLSVCLLTGLPVGACVRLHVSVRNLESRACDALSGGFVSSAANSVSRRQRRASVWISSYGGILQRRTDAADLRPSAIFEAFCAAYIKQPRFHPLEALAASTVIAYLVSMVWTGSNWASTVEYFTQASLYTYLHERLRVEDRKSILQLFLPPAGAETPSVLGEGASEV